MGEFYMDKIIGFPEWIYEAYNCDFINNKFIQNSSCKEIFSCAYREYDEGKGATGGPGGVLYVQRKLIGNRLRNVRLSYLFKSCDYRVPEHIWEQLGQLNGKVKVIIAGAGYILSNLQIKESIESEKNPILVCHDLGSAYGAYLLGVEYVLIYHQQGSIINEINSMGADYSEEDKRFLSFIEREVMSKAHKIYFPSYGARMVFTETSLLTEDEILCMNFAEESLYNTIEDITIRQDVGKVFDEWQIKINDDDRVFVSVGDYVIDKGIDRIPDFLALYQEMSGYDVVWITIGNEMDADYLAGTKDTCTQKGIRFFPINRRIPHSDVLALIENAAYYIMLHRKSIFDLATLEAMRSGRKVILSDCDSNREFNVLDNIVLVGDDFRNAVENVLKQDALDWNYRNRQAFRKFFSYENFQKRYCSMLNSILIEKGEQIRYRSAVNKKYLEEWRNRFQGKKCVICGSGQSLENLKEQEDDCIYIALNKALFYPNIHFDILFMQDEPKNQDYVLEDYNLYDCVKFYGIITNSAMPVEGLGREDAEFHNVVNRIYRYELAPVVFDYKVDEFEKQLDEYCFTDAQSVLFSALQFAIYAGFSQIWLCGVEFGKYNYGNTINMSRYAVNVVNNLIAFKRKAVCIEKVEVFDFLFTQNEFLREKFWDIDFHDTKVTVSGIYTSDYRPLVKLQELTCMDDYFFEFRFISDEQWKREKTDNGFAFFGGNTIKTQLVIDKIIEHWGEIILITDADLVFFVTTKGQILHELENVDMLFLRERSENEKRYERASSNINIGFVVIRCNSNSLEFWKQVQEETAVNKGWDQEVVNQIICENRTKLKYKLLPEYYLNGGSINNENLKRQKICTACGSIAKRLGLSKEAFLREALNNYHRNKWF